MPNANYERVRGKHLSIQEEQPSQLSGIGQLFVSTCHFGEQNYFKDVTSERFIKLLGPEYIIVFFLNSNWLPLRRG